MTCTRSSSLKAVQKKLELATPEIAEMKAAQTEGKYFVFDYEGTENGTKVFGPS